MNIKTESIGDMVKIPICRQDGVEISERGRPHRGLSPLDLWRLIVYESDRKALVELVQYRRIFVLGGIDTDLLLPEYIYEFSTRRACESKRVATEMFDRAYDLTLEKFTALPTIDNEKAPKHLPDDEGERESRVDCRKYYAALLNHVDHDEDIRKASGALAREHILAAQFQKLVNYHFHMSLIEAKRQINPFISRYDWHVDGRGVIRVRMPKYLKGQERGAWLEEHVENPDPKRPGERERVQAIIDKELSIPNFVPVAPERDVRSPSGFPAPDVQTERNMRIGFTQFLAREKALSAKKQRPAIKELGPEKIERLVNVVVPNLVTRERTDAEIARDHGLSKTALSHFCGSQWSQDKKTGKTVIPDLWRNAAELLSQVEAFRDIAGEAGVFKAAVTIVNQDGPAKLRRTNDVQ